MNVFREMIVTRPRRAILLLYCLLVAYCCIWVPWVANFEGMKDIHQGYGWIWSPPAGTGVPNLAAIVTRIGAVTGLSAAAFIAAKRWKLLLLAVAMLAVVLGAHDYWKVRAAEKQASKIHQCAVAKVASGGCLPATGRFQVCDYGLPNNAAPEVESALLSEAERACTAELSPSAHREIEEYRRQNGLKQ